MSSLKKHAGILRILAKAKPSVIRAIVRDSDTDLLYLLSECAVNILKGNVKLTKKNKTKLRKHTGKLRKLASKKINLNTRKEIIQKGHGFLASMLLPIIPMIPRLIKDAVKGVKYIKKNYAGTKKNRTVITPRLIKDTVKGAKYINKNYAARGGNYIRKITQQQKG